MELTKFDEHGIAAAVDDPVWLVFSEHRCVSLAYRDYTVSIKSARVRALLRLFNPARSVTKSVIHIFQGYTQIPGAGGIL